MGTALPQVYRESLRCPVTSGEAEAQNSQGAAEGPQAQTRVSR